MTRKEAEQRALELYPNTHIATVNHLHEVSRDAFLQCWDEMQVPMSPQEAKERALELYPIHPEFDVDRLKPLREAYLQGWDEAQQGKQTCGFCVEPATELTNEKHSENLDTKEDEGSELPSEKQIENTKLREAAEEWNKYKSFLQEKYPVEEGEEWQFTCEQHQKIDEILNSKIIKPKQIR